MQLSNGVEGMRGDRAGRATSRQNDASIVSSPENWTIPATRTDFMRLSPGPRPQSERFPFRFANPKQHHHRQQVDHIPRAFMLRAPPLRATDFAGILNGFALLDTGSYHDISARQSDALLPVLC